MTPFEFLLASFSSAAALICLGLGFSRSGTRFGQIITVVAALGLFFGISTVAGPRLIVREALALSALAVTVGVTYLIVRGIRFLAVRPKAAAASVVVAGVSVAGIGSVVYDHWSNADTTQHFERMLELTAAVPELASHEEIWVTDLGTILNVRVAAKPRESEVIQEEEGFCLDNFGWREAVIQRRPADDRTNCHGWVFAGGQAWVLGEDVPKILHDNDYLRVKSPQPGDLAIYRGDDGTYKHTALVRSVGDVVMVEGKWGWMGVYLHESDRSCYGTTIEYYRASRASHIVAHGSPSDFPQVTGGAE